MISISFEDLKLVDTLKHLDYMSMLHPDNDKLMMSVLGQIGFDVSKPIKYLPSKHRTLANKIVINFRAVGEIDKYYKNHDIYTRIAVAGMDDIEMARDMCGILNSAPTFESRLPELSGGYKADEFPPEMIEKDYEEVRKQIRQLEDLKDFIRKGV
jgi:hypothetical protein